MNSRLPAVIKKIILRAALPAAAAIITTSITPPPAACGAAPSSVTQSSQTYKDPVCNSMVKDLETEIAETTASLKDCGAPAPASPKAAAAKAKECEEYHRKLKLTKENLLQVKDQCDKGLTPGYLPKVIENPGEVPCAQCQAGKSLQRDPPAKTLTGLPAAGKVMDLKGSDPVFAAVVRKPAAATPGIPDPGEPTVLCICANGRDLGWMLLSACQSSAVQSQCSGVTPPPVEPPPVINPPVEPPPVVVPPTEPPSTTQPPAGKPGFWKGVLNAIKAVVKAILAPLKWIADKLNDLLHSVFKNETEKCNGNYYNPEIECCKAGEKRADKIADIAACPPPRYKKTTPNTDDYGCGKNGITRDALNNAGYVLGAGKTIDNPTGGGYTSFFGACYQHDGNYGACNKGPQTDKAYKDAADQAFYSRMKAICDNIRNSVEEKSSCHPLAGIYFVAVSDEGDSFYQGAQLENCKCCPLGALP